MVLAASAAVGEDGPMSLLRRVVRPMLAALTEREREVAVLMTQGLTNNQIGTRLHLSLASVKSHLTSLFVKLGVDNRVSAAMIIRDAGL